MNEQFAKFIQSGNIFTDNNNIEKAIEQYQFALEYADFEEQKIDIYNSIGRLYLQLNNRALAILSFNKSLDIHHSLSVEKKELLKMNMAAIMNNLGALLMIEDLKRSIEYHSDALKIFKELVDEGALIYQLHLSNTYFSLGEAYNNKPDYYQAKRNYQAAIKLYKVLLESNESIVKPLMANAYYNMADIAIEEHDLTSARAYLTKSLFQYQELVLDRPQSFRPILAATLNNLAVVSKNSNKYGDAIRYYLATLEQYEILLTVDRTTYLSYYASTLNNLGIVYTQKHEVRDAIGEIDSGAFTGFGTLSADSFYDEKKELELKKDKEKAIQYYNKALQSYSELVEEESENYMPYLATTLHNLGVLYDENRLFNEANEYYNKALRIRKKLALNNPKAFDTDVCVTLLNIITMNQTIMEQTQDLSYKNKSLELIDEAMSRLKKYNNDDRAIIKSMKSDIAYYLEFYKNVNETYLKILAAFGKIDEWTEAINTVLKPLDKWGYQQKIINTLELLFETYPEEDRVADELVKAYVDGSWVALRSNQLAEAKKIIDRGMLIDKTSNNLLINKAHYLRLSKESSKANSLYEKLLKKDKSVFEKIIEEDLAKLKSDGVLK